LLEILDGVYTAANNKEVTALIGLDLSTAFDTVNHEILLERLQTEFGVEGMPLAWLRSYLDGWTWYVKIGPHQSTAIQLEVGVPQGSVLGPILFAVYASPVADVIASQCVQYQQHADNTHLHPCNARRQHIRRTVRSCRMYYRRQTVVHTERPAAQPRQIRSTDHRNSTSATLCNINRVVHHCRRRRSATIQRNEGARSHPRSAPDF